MRALILTGQNSFDQRAVSRALKRAFSVQADTCVVVSALELIGPHPSLSQIRALEQALETPRGFAFLSAGDSFRYTGKPKTPVYELNARYADSLRLLLREGEFDAVLCLCRYCAEAVTHVRKRLAFSARCCFVSCDYACVPFLEETQMQYFFTPHDSLTTAYVSRGIPVKQIVPCGIPMPDDWFCEEDRADARTLLNLPQHMPCYLIPHADDTAAALDALLHLMQNDQGRVCVVSPEELLPKSPFTARYAGDVRVVLIDPEESLKRYFAASDVMLCAPCGALSAAAAKSGMPLVHLPARNSMDEKNARFFSVRGMSRTAQSIAESASCAVSLASDPKQRDSVRRAQKGESMESGSARIVRFLHEGRFAS